MMQLRCCVSRKSALQKDPRKGILADNPADKPERLSLVVSRASGSIGISLTDANMVTDVAEGSAAAQAGMLARDVVIGVNGQPLGPRKVVSLLAETHDPSVTLEIERGGPTPTVEASSRQSYSGRAPDLGDSPRSGSFAAPGCASPPRLPHRARPLSLTATHCPTGSRW